MNKNILFVFSAAILNVALIGCQPKSTAEKVENKIEDATHETGQAIERAGDRIKKSAN